MYKSYLQTELYQHQQQYIDKYGDVKRHYISFEMRVGKTKTFVALAIKQMLNHNIDCCIICAPIVNHLDIKREFEKWTNNFFISSVNKTEKDLIKAIINLKKKEPTVFITSYEFWNTKKSNHLKHYTHFNQCFHIYDECDVLGNSKNIVYKNIETSINEKSFVRLVSGTGLTTNVKNLYSQVRLIDNTIWLALNIKNQIQFENRYFKMLPQSHPLVQKVLAKNSKLRRTSFSLPELDEKTNLPIVIRTDELSAIVNKVSSNIIRTDLMAEGGKNYIQISFDLNEEQKQLYKKVQQDVLYDENTGGAFLAIQKEMMYKKIISGISPIVKITDEKTKAKKIITQKDRAFIKAFLELQKKGERILCFFTLIEEINFYKKLFKAKGIKASVIQGDVPSSERDKIILDFQQTPGSIVLATITAAGIGTTFSKGNNILFYSNLYSLRARKQAEDRCSALGKKEIINVYDFTCGRIDEKIRQAHLNNINIVSSILKKLDREVYD